MKRKIFIEDDYYENKENSKIEPIEEPKKKIKIEVVQKSKKQIKKPFQETKLTKASNIQKYINVKSNSKERSIVNKFGENPTGLKFIIGYNCSNCDERICSTNVKRCYECDYQNSTTIKVKYALEDNFFEDSFEYLEKDEVKKTSLKYTSKNIHENMVLFWNIMREHGSLDILNKK
jgi:hypothetical protein